MMMAKDEGKEKWDWDKDSDKGEEPGYETNFGRAKPASAS